MTAGVYQIKNIVTGKVYVGSSVDMQSRWDQHRGALRRGDHHSTHLQHAWNKYDEAAFEFEIIIEIGAVDGLIDLEQQWIDALNAADGDHGYNVCPTAGGTRGFRHSVETRHKQSETAKRQGRKPTMTTEQRAATLAKIHAMPRTPEWRAKISSSNVGKSIPLDVRAKISKKLKVFYSEESNRQKLFDQSKKAAQINSGNKYAAGRVMPQEEIIRRSESMKKSHARRCAQRQEV